MTRAPASVLLLVVAILLGGCAGEQSAFAPAGVEAARVSVLFWVMTIGGFAILVWVCIAVALAVFGGETTRTRLSRENFITAFGIAMPTVILTVLLGYGFVVLRAGASTTATMPKASAPERTISTITPPGERRIQLGKAEL